MNEEAMTPHIHLQGQDDGPVLLVSNIDDHTITFVLTDSKGATIFAASADTYNLLEQLDLIHL